MESSLIPHAGRKIDVSSGGESAGEPLAEEFLEVANGCLCCSIKDTGAAAIEKLMKKRGKFDYILLETTGLADPGPIASIFWHNEDLSEEILLDGVVCVVDGVFGLEQLEKDKGTGKHESMRQIACADIILLNKVDLTPSLSLSALDTTIRSINPTATVERTVKGCIDLSKILDLHAYSSRPNLSQALLVSKESFTEPHDHAHDEHCPHFNDVTSLLIPIPVLTLSQNNALDGWIRSILWESRIPEREASLQTPSKIEIIRCKGLWHTEEGRTFVLQGVRSLYEISEVVAKPTDGQIGKVVLIGRGLDRAVYTSLQALLA